MLTHKEKLTREIFTEGFNAFMVKNVKDKALEEIGNRFSTLMNNEFYLKGMETDEIIALIASFATSIVCLMDQSIEKKLILPVEARTEK